MPCAPVGTASEIRAAILKDGQIEISIARSDGRKISRKLALRQFHNRGLREMAISDLRRQHDSLRQAS
jgi:signal recognition particle subunit SEC65